MLKKITIIALVIMTVMTAALPMALAENSLKADGKYEKPFTMYVYTENGGFLNVRSTPNAAERNVIGKIDFGKAVTVTGVSLSNPDWVSIRYSKGTNGTAWVLAAFLTKDQPKQTAAQQVEINRQLATYKAVDRSFTIAAKPSGKGGYVNFRDNPGLGANRIAMLKKGHTLTVIGETTDWYQAMDSVSGKIGFVSKRYVSIQQ